MAQGRSKMRDKTKVNDFPFVVPWLFLAEYILFSIFNHLAVNWDFYLESGRTPDGLIYINSSLGSYHGEASADTQ